MTHHSDCAVRWKILLSFADVRIGGDRPWDMRIRNDDVFARVLAHGSIALGESYMDDWWDCDRLDEFFYRILQARLDEKVKLRTEFIDILKARLMNRQNTVPLVSGWAAPLRHRKRPLQRACWTSGSSTAARYWSRCRHAR